MSSSPIFTLATLSDGPTTRDADYWYSTVVKPASDAVGTVLGDQADWINMPYQDLQGGWVPYAALSGGNFPQPAYRTYGTLVRFQGLVKNGASGSAATPIFTMPPELCPSTIIVGQVVSDTGVAKLQLDPTGALWVSLYVAGGSNAFVFLDSFHYFAE